MSRLGSSFALYATICAVIVLALVASVVSYDRISPWPFPPDDNDGGNIASGVHISPWPFPPDDNDGGNIASGVRISPWPFPPDDNDGGNIRLV